MRVAFRHGVHLSNSASAKRQAHGKRVRGDFVVWQKTHNFREKWRNRPVSHDVKHWGDRCPRDGKTAAATLENRGLAGTQPLRGQPPPDAWGPQRGLSGAAEARNRLKALPANWLWIRQWSEVATKAGSMAKSLEPKSAIVTLLRIVAARGAEPATTIKDFTRQSDRRSA